LSTGIWVAMMDDFITWRGIEQMYLDLYDRPEWIHQVMNRNITIEGLPNDQNRAF
jgi:hypothetical protein